MSIQFTCPQCGVTTEVDDRFAGQSGPCRQCGATVTVPGAPAAAQPFSPPPKKSSTPIIIIVVALCLVGVAMLLCLLPALLLPAVQSAREAARRSQCTNNLKQISFALMNYHDVYKEFPPQYFADENGKPMHSWRVLILPYLEHKLLYDQYDFNEPWDGPHNSLLAAQMPAVFRCPSDPGAGVGGTITSYVGVSGPGSFFDGQKSAKPARITDGTSNTITVVEFAGGGVHWMEPRDLDASLLSGIVSPPDGQNISSYHPGGANAAFADGSVRFLSSTIDPQVLRGLTTIAGNEILQNF